MTISATANASDEDLKGLGLITKGDIISIKTFCQDALKNDEQQEKSSDKVALLERIMQSNKSKRKLRDTGHARPSKMKFQESQVSKKVQLGWLHYDEKQNKYICVRTPRGGGGTRDISLPLNTTAEEVIGMGKELFFPNDVSYYSISSEMEFSLANFKQEIIETLDVDNKTIPFTLEKYILATKLQKVRLYLASKNKRECSKTEATENTCSERTLHSDLLDGQIDDSDLLYSVFDCATSNTITAKQDNLKDGKEDSHGNSREDQDHLDFGKLKQAGTSRFVDDGASQATNMNTNTQSMFDINATRELKAQQDLAYMDSLSKDKDKSEKLMQELAELEKQEKLRQSRIERLPEKPSPGKDTVLIKVQHVTLGTIHRRFAAHDSMLSVYDWVGSRSLLPMHFQLSNAQGLIYKPDESVQDVKAYTLHMVECTATPDIEDVDITFKGLGSQNEDNIDDTIPLEVQQNSQSCPSSSQMGEVNPAADINNCQQDISTEPTRERTFSDPGTRFRQVFLRDYMQSQGILLNEEEVEEPPVGLVVPSVGSVYGEEVTIHRVCVKADLMNVLKKNIPSESASFRMIDDRGRVEEGEGIGVTRDVFATFWQQVFSSVTVGDIEKVPVIRHDYQYDEWKALGEILVYGFQHLNFFPLGISKAFLASCLFGEKRIEKDYLLSSFRNYITPDEREVFDKVSQGDISDDDSEDLLDFLGNYKSYKVATKENVQVIMLELAHQELIQRPRYIAQCWSEPLSSLKNKKEFKTPQDIASLYEERRPTTKKVVRALQASPSNDAERQSLDFLKKFIRSLDVKSLETFLKLTTGSFTMMNEGLAISFTTLEGLARRPIFHTCGPLLELPCTYQSYPELAEEFTSILREQGAWGFNIV